jgi:hypothetical protein
MDGLDDDKVVQGDHPFGGDQPSIELSNIESKIGRNHINYQNSNSLSESLDISHSWLGPAGNANNSSV